jgi:hypothetical protein
MTFQTELPSLVDKWRSAKDFPPDYIVVPVLDVLENCTDKNKQIEMKFKDYQPIKFEIMQNDMEIIMFSLNHAIKLIQKDPTLANCNEKLLKNLINIKTDLQKKIYYHRQIGEWK